MNSDYSIGEMITCFLSRDIEDGEGGLAGANLIIPRAALLLAHFHHGPNMRVATGMTSWTNMFDTPTVQVYGTSDYRGYHLAEYARHHDEGFDQMLKMDKGIFFFGGIQIDQYGNMNMFGIGDNHKKLKIRGPGAIGLAHVSTHIKRFYVLAMDHTKRRFVPKLDFLSIVGHGDGPDYRKKWKLKGGGPRWVISPLGIMDFDEETKRMRLKSVHPNVTVDQVVENTGFELIIPSDVPTTEPPTEDELHILRTRVDPKGVLRMF